MVSSFTWNQFILAVVTTGVVYYLVVLLLFYRRDVEEFLFRRQNRTNLQANQPNPPQVSIIGAATTEVAPLLSEAAAIQIAPSQVIGPVPEDDGLQGIQSEIQSLLQTVTAASMTKDDFLLLLGLITVKYAPLTQADHREAIGNFLLEESKLKLPFELSFSDLHTLWPKDLSGV